MEIGKRYVTYVDALRVAGIEEGMIQKLLEEHRAEDEALDALSCPECGGVLTVCRSARMKGRSQVGGEWYEYRCGSCRYLMNRRE